MTPVYQQHVAQMDPTDLRAMAQGFHQMGQEQPDMRGQLLGGLGSLLGGGSALGEGRLCSLAALAAKAVMGARDGGL